MAKKYYSQDIPGILAEFGSDANHGISSAEAKKRLDQYGPNALAGKKKRSMFARFMDQFKDLMIIVLLVAAVLSGVVAQEWTDAGIILVVVLLNAVLGVIQEARSEAAIEALKVDRVAGNLFQVLALKQAVDNGDRIFPGDADDGDPAFS